MTLAAAISKTTSAWAVGTGNGALDTGTIANSTWYHVYVIERTDTGALIGNCGLIRREGLDGPDLGYALLPGHAGHGFAHEAARAVIADASDRLGITCLRAIVNPDNAPSIGLLQKLGFEFDKMIVLPHVAHPLDLFHLHLSTEAAA